MIINCFIINTYNGDIIESFDLVFNKKILNSNYNLKGFNFEQSFYNQNKYSIEKILKSERNPNKKEYSHIINTSYNYGYKGKNSDYNSVQLYVKLNLIESIRLKFINKDFIIQSKEIKTDIIKYIIGGILGFFGTILIQKISDAKKPPEKPPIQVIKKSLDHTYEQKSDTNLKIDSIVK